jgi:hypothetical protein
MIPAARQRVCVKGRSGVFYVLTVNQDSGCADLVELNSATLVEAVRFENILPFLDVIEPYKPPSSI